VARERKGEREKEVGEMKEGGKEKEESKCNGGVRGGGGKEKMEREREVREIEDGGKEKGRKGVKQRREGSGEIIKRGRGEGM
jgi:hypothetical protein